VLSIPRNQFRFHLAARCIHDKNAAPAGIDSANSANAPNSANRAEYAASTAKIPQQLWRRRPQWNHRKSPAPGTSLHAMVGTNTEKPSIRMAEPSISARRMQFNRDGRGRATDDEGIDSEHELRRDDDRKDAPAARRIHTG
jgi:hypothetical protein